MAFARTNWGHSRKFLAVEGRRETQMTTEGGLVAKRHASLRDVTCGPGKKPGTLRPGAVDGLLLRAIAADAVQEHHGCSGLK